MSTGIQSIHEQSELNNIQRLCVDGSLDEIYDNLIFMVSMKLMTEQQLKEVYLYLDKYGKTNKITGLLDLSTWIRNVWLSYIKFNTFPTKVLKDLIGGENQELNHISSNYISYMGKVRESGVKINLDEYLKMSEFLEKFFPNLEITKKFLNIKWKLKTLDASNKNTLSQLLYSSSRELEYSELSSVIKRKLKSCLNKVRLQIDAIKVEKEDDFTIFLKEEGIIEAIEYILKEIQIDEDYSS